MQVRYQERTVYIGTRCNTEDGRRRKKSKKVSRKKSIKRQECLDQRSECNREFGNLCGSLREEKRTKRKRGLLGHWKGIVFMKSAFVETSG